MLANLESSGGRLASERILLKLVEKGALREEAYRWVQRCALGDGDFRARIAGDPDIARLLARAEIDELFGLEHALRNVDCIIDRALEEEP
jgi:adenylosuccinate lyase